MANLSPSDGTDTRPRIRPPSRARGGRSKRGPSVQRGMTDARLARGPGRSPKTSGIDPDLIGVVASVIAVAVLLAMLLLQPFTQISQFEGTWVHAIAGR